MPEAKKPKASSRRQVTMSYKNLEIWQLAREIALEVHKMTLEDLPKFEMYETGQQIRRSSKSCRS
ncbi:MAG TPA: four helix bundle protein, partial [Draconibacterium sp.]|nr:four helix bundle protein [Draconibacterium sp.]